jgi:hypothetical protein
VCTGEGDRLRIDNGVAADELTGVLRFTGRNGLLNVRIPGKLPGFKIGLKIGLELLVKYISTSSSSFFSKTFLA